MEWDHPPRQGPQGPSQGFEVVVACLGVWPRAVRAEQVVVNADPIGIKMRRRILRDGLASRVTTGRGRGVHHRPLNGRHRGVRRRPRRSRRWGRCRRCMRWGWWGRGDRRCGSRRKQRARGLPGGASKHGGNVRGVGGPRGSADGVVSSAHEPFGEPVLGLESGVAGSWMKGPHDDAVVPLHAVWCARCPDRGHKWR